MASATKKGRSRFGPPFIRIPNPVYDTAIVGRLSPQELAVLTALIRRYNGLNNGWLALSVRDAAAEAKINKDTAMRAFQSLQKSGLIEEVQHGAFAWKARHASEWRLTWEKCDRTGRPASHAYREEQRNANPHPGPK
jgi:hypothetical protein